MSEEKIEESRHPANSVQFSSSKLKSMMSNPFGVCAITRLAQAADVNLAIPGRPIVIGFQRNGLVDSLRRAGAHIQSHFVQRVRFGHGERFSPSVGQRQEMVLTIGAPVVDAAEHIGIDQRRIWRQQATLAQCTAHMDSLTQELQQHAHAGGVAPVGG